MVAKHMNNVRSNSTAFIRILGYLLRSCPDSAWTFMTIAVPSKRYIASPMRPIIFQKSKILLLDSNYSVETLAYVLAHSSEIEHVIYEPISNEKSKRILHSDLLSHLTILKPNLI